MGPWARFPNENGVGSGGTSHCELKGSFYRGKLAGSDQCKATCQGDPICIAWSYNNRNLFMPGSVGRCWGAS